MTISRILSFIAILLGSFWLAGQFLIVFYPQLPMIQRPLHLMLALGLVILWKPLDQKRLGSWLARLIDIFLFSGTVLSTIYYLSSVTRLTERMENVDKIFPSDVIFGFITIIVVLECVRRVVGWSLLGVLLVFLFYGFTGSFFPGWLRFQSFNYREMIEIMTMTGNGLLGITTYTSVQFVFYFVAFGAIYSLIGGSRLFIDIGLFFAGKQKGGAAKAAVISSSMMGMISGSAVANVTATGVFTIPLMKRAGLSPERAAAIEAVASTGGMLMPPIMGVSAFVMAELLQVDYGRIALAGAIPGVAYYVALFLAIDLHARKTGIGNMSSRGLDESSRILPRLYLLLPPVVLIFVLIKGYSATYAALMGCVSCFLTAYLRRNSWLTFKGVIKMIEDVSKQASQVAVPIGAIGIIIAVAIQSNLALKFSTRIIEISGGSLVGTMFFLIIGCIIMGMGLPAVASYIIGAVLFVPALIKLGIPELPSHFFVMFFSVLANITPPVALASYTAAGLANANIMRTSLIALYISLSAFFIPFAFAFDEALLWKGTATIIAAGCLSLLLGTGTWAIAFVGYLNRPLLIVERVLFAIGSLTVILSPTGSLLWYISIFFILGMLGLLLIFRKITKLSPK